MPGGGDDRVAGGVAVMAGRRPRVTADDVNGSNPLRPAGAQDTSGIVHGLTSKRALKQKSEAIVNAMLTDPHCPLYLRTPAFAASVMAWGQAEAMAALAWEYMCVLLDDGGPAAIFGMREGQLKAQSEVWKAHASFASQMRSKLGIDPSGYAKLARELNLQQNATAGQLQQMADRGGEIAQRRLAIAGETG